MLLEVEYRLTQQQGQKLTHQEQGFLHSIDITLVTIVFIIHHLLGLDLVSVHDMLMAEPLNFAEELRDLEPQGALRGASQMLRSGFQPFKTLKIQRIMEIDLFLIHLKSGQ